MRQEFIEKCRAELSDSYYERSSYVYQELEDYERSSGKSIESGCFTRQDYISILSRMRSRTVTYFGFCVGRLRRYLEWLVENGVLTEDAYAPLDAVQMSDLSDSKNPYFRDFEALDAHIEQMLRNMGDSTFNSNYRPQIVALYLAWYGLSIEQILSVRKTDVMNNGVMVDGVLIPMDDVACSVIQTLRSEDRFNRLGSPDSYLCYKDSEYLFRTHRSPRMSASRLNSRLSEFCTEFSPDRVINFSLVSTSGAFYRLRQMELSGQVDLSTPESQKAYFGTGRTTIFRYMTDYRLYCELFE